MNNCKVKLAEKDRNGGAGKTLKELIAASIARLSIVRENSEEEGSRMSNMWKNDFSPVLNCKYAVIFVKGTEKERNASSGETSKELIATSIA